MAEIKAKKVIFKNRDGEYLLPYVGSELNNPFSLLDYKYSEYELNNISWLRSNGQYNSKAIYPAVYDLLLKIYNGVETKAGVSVKLSTEEYTDYDFVLNTAEETFRLPVKVKLASGKAVVGTEYGLGLTPVVPGTEYTDYVYYLAEKGAGTAGTAYFSDYFTKPQKKFTELTAQGSGISNNRVVGVTPDPTKSGIETSDSDLYLYFYVGETVQNANLINAGRIEEIKANRSELDGQWEITSFGLITSTTSIKPDQTLTFDISDYLPKDNNIYEVILSGSIVATATSGNHLNLLYRTDIMPVNTNLCRVATRTASSMFASGSCTVLVGAGRTIEIFASGGSVGTNSIDSLGLRAYRKVR
jgi:hypothetical protein